MGNLNLNLSLSRRRHLRTVMALRMGVGRGRRMRMGMWLWVVCLGHREHWLVDGIVYMLCELVWACIVYWHKALFSTSGLSDVNKHGPEVAGLIKRYT